MARIAPGDPAMIARVSVCRSASRAASLACRICVATMAATACALARIPEMVTSRASTAGSAPRAVSSRRICPIAKSSTAAADPPWRRSFVTRSGSALARGAPINACPRKHCSRVPASYGTHSNQSSSDSHTVASTENEVVAFVSFFAVAGRGAADHPARHRTASKAAGSGRGTPAVQNNLKIFTERTLVPPPGHPPPSPARAAAANARCWPGSPRPGRPPRRPARPGPGPGRARPAR